MRGTPLEPSKSIGAFPDVPDLETSGEEAYVFFHLEPKHTNYINRIIEGYEFRGYDLYRCKWTMYAEVHTFNTAIGYRSIK